MNDLYANDGASKKKFLAPVLVMLLCMVSLSGAAFAYTATVTNTDDVIDPTGITLELCDSNGTALDAGVVMYAVDDVHIATHTTNGYALNYDGAIGFKADPAQGTLVYGSGQGESTTLTDFAEGYYVQAYNGDTPVGYKSGAAPTISSLSDVNAAVAAGTLFQLDGTYKLNVDNQSGENVDLKMKTKLDAAYPAYCPVKAIYIVIIDSAGTTYVCSDVAAVDAVYDAVATITAAGVTTYTINAYIALTDYYSAALPTFDDIGFVVSFNAVNAAVAP